jgi:putative transport protein
VIDYFNQNPVLLLMLVASAGYFLGQIRIKGFALESSAILFVALLAGHLGLIVPETFKILGLVLFIYSVGLQAGPKARILLKKEGMVLNLLAMGTITIGALLTLSGQWLFNLEKNISIGIFSGALTSTPGLASAYEATGSRLTSIGYGIAYPLGVLGVILFVRLLPYLLKQPVREEERKEREQREKNTDLVISRQVEITNPNVVGQSIGELKFLKFTGCVISRLLQEGNVLVPSVSTRLQRGDVVKIVGVLENIEQAVLLLGRFSERHLPGGNLELGRFVLTNRELVGKKIRDLNIRYTRDANITRITRSGIDLPALPDFSLQWGDRISIVAEKEFMSDLKSFFGDDIKKAEEANVFSMVLGIALGIVIGLIPVAIGRIFSFKLGLTGGILISGIFFSNRARLGPVVWRIPTNIVHFIRELGLIFFLAAVGCEAGQNILPVIQQNGIGLILWGALVTFLPMLLMILLVRITRLVTLLELMGLLPGGMTSTPGFGIAASMSDSETPVAIYAAVYPLAMIVMIIWTKVLALF